MCRASWREPVVLWESCLFAGHALHDGDAISARVANGGHPADLGDLIFEVCLARLLGLAGFLFE